MSDILDAIRGPRLFTSGPQPKQDPAGAPLTGEELVGKRQPQQKAGAPLTGEELVGKKPEVTVDDIELQQIQEMQRDELRNRQDVVMRGRKFLDDAFRSVASGLTSGFSEEAGAFVESVIRNREYMEELATQRAREKAVDPTTRIIGELTGGVIQGIAPGAMLFRGTQGAARIAAFAAEAAVEGALSGFGHAEGDAVNRLAGAGQGAAVGAVVGAVAPVVADNVVEGARRLMGHPAVSKAQQQAILKLTKAMQRDEISPERAMAKLAQLGPVGVISDLPGGNVRALAEAAANVPGPARQVAERELTTRLATSPTRVEDAIKVAGSDASVLETRNALIAARQAAARPLYDAAMAKGQINTPAIQVLIDKSADIRAGIKQAKRFPEYADLPDNHIALLDKAYKNVGGKAMEATRAGNKELARDLNNVRSQLRDAMPDEYKQALDMYSSASDLTDALDLGRRFIKMDGEVLDDAVKHMTSAEKQQAVIGASRAIRDKLDNAQDSVATVRRIFGNEGIRERLKIILPPGQFRDFQKTMLQEAVFAKTTAKVLGGSPTATRQAAISDMVSGGKSAVQGDAVGIVQAIARMIPKAPPSKELGKTLFTTDPGFNRTVFDQMQEQMLRRDIARPLAGGLVGGAANQGAQVGR
jgi:hypothetical protein